ncbi:MAG: hypothetical protein M9962_11220 [Oligoflexia bacterium]|nr:hypothetical protein [Oligoflexia bacterium]
MRILIGKINGEEVLMGGTLKRQAILRKPLPLNKGEKGDIILMARQDSEEILPKSNVPREYTFSEADNWGYDGTGPVSLARNVLFHFTEDKAFTEENYVFFVEDVVSRLSIDNSHVIYGEFIEAWIKSKQ